MTKFKNAMIVAFGVLAVATGFMALYEWEQAERWHAVHDKVVDFEPTKQIVSQSVAIEPAKPVVIVQPAAEQPVAKAPEPVVTVFIQGHGNGDKQTDFFEVHDREWLIAWMLESANPQFGDGYLTVNIRDRNGRLIKRNAVNTSEATNGDPGVTRVFTEPGFYFLEINGLNAEWEVDVLQNKR